MVYPQEIAAARRRRVVTASAAPVPRHAGRLRRCGRSAPCRRRRAFATAAAAGGADRGPGAGRRGRLGQLAAWSPCAIRPQSWLWSSSWPSRARRSSRRSSAASPGRFPIAAFAVLPLRVPVQVGGQTSHLLVPLYLVIAGGVVCFGYAALRGRSERRRRRAAGAAQPALRDSPAVVWLHRVLAATLVLYAIQSAYSVDVSNAIENASFFLVPFAVLFVMLGEVRWTRRLLGWVLIAVAADGACLRRGRVLGVRGSRPASSAGGTCSQSNQLHLYFRVNSLFYDPNILGRGLALVLVALGAYLAWARTRGSRSSRRSSPASCSPRWRSATRSPASRR